MKLRDIADGRTCTALALLSLFLVLPAAAQYVPPAGIPAPSFGINETPPALPNPWTGNVSGFYYVKAGGTNTGNGFPQSPRAQIPSSLPAGSVVVLGGTYAVNHESNPLSLPGTAAAPIWITGDPAARPTATMKWVVSGAYYVIEKINFVWVNASGNGKLEFGGNHGVVRDIDAKGDKGDGVGGVFPDGSDMVVYRSFIHDAGNVAATYDQDNHCIKLGTPSSRIWILDNEITRCSGDAIQVGDTYSAAEAAALHHIYIGRNNFHDTKQSGAWSKGAQHVIVSENYIHDFVPSNSSSGQCAGGQYGPDKVWFLFNRFENCLSGIRFEGDSGLGFASPVRYIVGNTFRHIAGGNEPTNPHAEAAITLRAGAQTYVASNTITDYNAGIKNPSDAKTFLENNILTGRNQADNFDVYIEVDTTAAGSTMKNNLVGSDFQVRWGSNNTISGLAAFQAATGKGQGSITATPGFVSSTDLHLASGSPAIDAGILSAAYAAFATLYGIDISKDIDGAARPAGAWDIGADEVGSGPAPTPTPSPVPTPPTPTPPATPPPTPPPVPSPTPTPCPACPTPPPATVSQSCSNPPPATCVNSGAITINGKKGNRYVCTTPSSTCTTDVVQ